MSTDRDTTRIVRSWLRIDDYESADRVLDAVLDALDTTPQRRATWWPARRLPEMNSYAKLGVAAAAVVVAAILGYSYLVAPNIGAPNLSSEPTPAASPSSAPAADLATARGRLEPGRYMVRDVLRALRPLQITITVPAGWERNVVPAMVWSSENQKTTVAYFTVEDLFADPCDATQGYLGVGPTIDDLVQAIATYPGITVKSTSDVTLSGYAGTLVDYASTDVDCGGGDALMMTTQPGDIGGGIDRPHPGGGAQHQQYLILDVEGERLVISIHAPAAASARRVDEAMSIVDSTEIAAP